MWVTVNSDFDQDIPDKLIESRSSRWLVTKWLKKRIDFVMFFKDGYFARQKSSKIAFKVTLQRTLTGALNHCVEPGKYNDYS